MKTYKFRIYPSGAQVSILNSTLNSCKNLYNAMLQQRIYACKMKKKITYYSQQNEIPDMKKIFPEFNNAHSQVLQDVARRVDKAYDNFFRRIREKNNGSRIKAGFPRFKSKDRYNSITYTQSGFEILEDGHVWLSKIGEVRMFMHRPVTGEIKTLSVKRDKAGDWFITITARNGTGIHEPEVYRNGQNPPSVTIKPVGIDLGLKSLITTSEGMQIEPPHYLGRSEKKLKKAQKSLSRKKKGSGKRESAKKRVAKVHRKIQRQRDDFIHKISSSLVENHDLIVFEDLNIAGMVKNHHLAKSIMDAAWTELVQFTAYRAESAGKVVVLVNPRGTSKTCSRCDWVKENLKLSDRMFRCDRCGLEIDRDLNAAINIRNRGIAKVGRGTPEFTPVEIGSLPARATPVAEAGSPLR